ncbi:carboxymuconolactone decarboxylase family protein [Fodinibius sediminis]|uniref:Uncharacterized peroxidase-related enzyme n=1 Tax=Fodinibius sediminis TaxID=1214077 RepID=A0A521CBH2_9BACT|nr:carboxymuconolactone decarboxylase family protein [Fodinibius sediminis]SMO56766.1 uncharacterized peroxidase-related enzyme [Fodinibius sediminis]
MSTQQSASLEPATLESAPAKSQELLQEAKDNLGFVPNMYKYMAQNPSLLNSYYRSYNAFREQAGFSPVEQEVILLSISFENRCHYCMAAHSFLAENASNVPEEVTEAIREGKEVPDARLAALSLLARSMVVNRGRPAKEELDAFFNAGYEEQHLLGIITAVGVKTFSNYMNHIVQTPVDKVFSDHSWSD